MSALLIENAEGIFTGLPGDEARAKGAIRIRNGVIAALGDLQPEPGERRVDASGCVIYPGLVSTHHHLFQSVMKGVQAGIDLPLVRLAALRALPRTGTKLDEEALAVAARIGLGGTSPVRHHHRGRSPLPFLATATASTRRT